MVAALDRNVYNQPSLFIHLSLLPATLQAMLTYSSWLVLRAILLSVGAEDLTEACVLYWGMFNSGH
jgi:hypothetical protein